MENQMLTQTVHEKAFINGVNVNNLGNSVQVVSEIPVLLGTDKGANPAKNILTPLSSRMTTSLVYHAAAQGINVEKVESDYEGDINLKGFLNLDPQVRKGYEEIRVQFKVKSDADKEKLNELVQNSPIYDVVTNPTPVKVEFITE